MSDSILARMFGHALVVCVLLLVPSLWLAPPTVWRLPTPQLLVLASFVAAYLVSLLVYRLTTKPGTVPVASHAILVSAAISGALTAALMYTEKLFPAQFAGPYQMEALLTGLLVSIAGFTLLHVPRLASPVSLGALGTMVIVGLIGQGAYRMRWLPRPTPPSRLVSVAQTSLYQLQLTRYDNWIPKHWRLGGGIAAWGQDYLVATGNGALFVISEREGGNGLQVTRLPRLAPLNADEFIAGAREVFKSFPQNYVESSRFRVADVLVQENGAFVRMLVSHHYWNVAGKCFVLRVSALEASRRTIQDASAKLDWRTLYQTSPCLSLNTDNPRGSRFDGLENGGRMALVNDDELLLTVGDHGFDGVNRAERLAQDSTTSYGKVLKIDIATGRATMFSMGHRNPQGLFVDENGTVWETEHGPQGGDEINLLRAGGNYGWPLVTYGTDYSRHSWPLNPSQGRHDGFEQPLFAFTPAVGISDIAGATGDRFPLWRGDLLVASLKKETLWRIRGQDGRIVLAEPIPIGQRIRDVLIGRDGRVVLWTDDSAVIFIEPTDAVTGDLLLSRCTGCHGFNVWDGSSPLGPNLHNVVGRRVASMDDFRYSQAIRSLGGRWTRERLDAFLADPQGMLPGTLMQSPGITDSDDRAKLIDFLANMPSGH